MRLPRGPNPPQRRGFLVEKNRHFATLVASNTAHASWGTSRALDRTRGTRRARAERSIARHARRRRDWERASGARAVRSCAGINADARATSGARCGGRSARGRVVCVVGTFRVGVARVDGGGARRRARGRGEFSGVECARWWLTTRAFARRRTVADRCVERATDECMFLCFLV